MDQQKNSEKVPYDLDVYVLHFLFVLLSLRVIEWAVFCGHYEKMVGHSFYLIVCVNTVGHVSWLNAGHWSELEDIVVCIW